jgi:hypothetical protein
MHGAKGERAKVVALLSCAVGVVLVTTVSLFLIIQAQRKPSLTEQVINKSRTLASFAPSYTYAYEIKDMSIPLTNKSHTRSAFAQFSLILDCPSEAAKKKMVTELPKLLDSILVVGSEFYVEDFQAPLAEKGFARFKDALRASYAKYLHEDTPREISIKDWFVN